MNKLIKPIVAVLFLFAASSVYAQRYYEPHLSIGAKGGVSFSSMSFTPDVPQSMVTGMVAGVSVRYTEENFFGLIAEINVEQRGWEEDFEEMNSKFSYQRHLTYLQVPILTHVYFGNKKFKGFLNLGPAVSYLIGDDITANFDYHNPTALPGFPANRHVKQMEMDVTRKFDYGILGGVGMEFILKKRHSFMLEARYYFGLGSIFPDAKKDEFSASRGTSIQVSLGYMFHIK